MISALPLKADMEVDFANVGLGPILLKNSPVETVKAH
jgi:hypothetical protein